MRRVICWALFLFTMVTASPLAAISKEQLVYGNDFAGAIGPEWSKTSIEATPKGNRRFLGQFGSETINLSLSKLPTHKAIRVSFDLIILNSWDGNTPGSGPDTWELSIKNGPILLHTTFSNYPEAHQSFPDKYPGGDHAACSCAAESDTMGYDYHGDAVYHLEYTVAHTSDSVAFIFAGGTNEPLWNESWGLDNIKVSVISDSSQLPEKSASVLGNTITIDKEDKIVVGRGDVVRVTGNIDDRFVVCTMLEDGVPVIAKKKGDGPYSLEWKTENAYLGRHDLHMVFVRPTGREIAKKIAVTVIEGIPITVKSPTNGSELLDPTPVELIPASDISISRVECYSNGNLVSSADNSKQLVLDIPSANSGERTLLVKAYTQYGSAWAAPFTIKVPDRVAIVSPKNGDTVSMTESNAKLDLEIRTPGKLKIAKVEIFRDRASAGYMKQGSNRVELDANNYRPGKYKLIARLTDAAGHEYDSSPVTIVLQNGPLLKREAEATERKRAEEAESVRVAEEARKKAAAEADAARLQKLRDEFSAFRLSATNAATAWPRSYSEASAYGKGYGKVKGTITYLHNFNVGNQPDTGTDVWLVYPDIDIPENCFVIGFSSYLLVSQSDINEELRIPVFKHTAVDGDGRYEITDVLPGRYTLVCRSKHTNGSYDGRITPLNGSHRLNLMSVTVYANQTADASFDFGITTIAL